eukprot:scaffold3149_cov26-Attheya_sp.AAC.2
MQQSDDYIGYCDASAFGAGGVWFGGERQLDPSVWRIVWPLDIRTAVISESNPKGRLTNSDLEMAGVLLLMMLVLETLAPLKHRRAVALCDNTPGGVVVDKIVMQGGVGGCSPTPVGIGHAPTYPSN